MRTVAGSTMAGRRPALRRLGARAGIAVALLLASLTAAAAPGARVPAPDPRQGDGRVSAFYTWEHDIPAPGKWLRSEPLQAEIGLSSASSQVRFLYSSTHGFDGRTPIVVSGALFVPKGTPPAGGWPVMAWGHGTVGLADICAPSWQGRVYRSTRYLNRWLDEGFAVVATDYQGLGVPGPHPLINVPALAYSVLDSARAAISGVPGLANAVVIAGQSQGGLAAFAAAAHQPGYAPELGVKGTIATGVIYRDPNAEQVPLVRNPHEVTSALAYGVYGFLVDQQHDPSLRPEEVFTERALPVLEQARAACLSDLMADVVFDGFTAANSRLPEPGPGYRRYLEGAHERAARYAVYPTLKLAHPILIGTGADDRTPAATSQLALMRDACAAGTVVEGHLYAGHGHSAAVNTSLKDAIPFAKKVIAGEPVTPVCQPQLE
jgi:pimeloyl-ACP methyl ester carboxylesterase